MILLGQESGVIQVMCGVVFLVRKMVVKRGARWCVSTSAKIPLFGDLWIKDDLFLSTDVPVYAPLAHVKGMNIIDQASKLVTKHRLVWKAE